MHQGQGQETQGLQGVASLRSLSTTSHGNMFINHVTILNNNDAMLAVPVDSPLDAEANKTTTEELYPALSADVTCKYAYGQWVDVPNIANYTSQKGRRTGSSCQFSMKWKAHY